MADYTITVTYHLLPPTVLTVASANQPAGSYVGFGTTHAVDGFTLARTGGAGAIGVSAVAIEDTGTLPTDAVAGVQVYRDNGDNVFVVGDDTLLNATPATFAGATSTVTFDSTEPVTDTPQQYWVVYEFGSIAVYNDDEASSRVAAATQTGADAVTNDAVVGQTFYLGIHAPDVAILSPASNEVMAQNPWQIYGTAADYVGVVSAEVRITRDDGRVWDGSAWSDSDTWLPAALAATGTVRYHLELRLNRLPRRPGRGPGLPDRCPGDEHPGCDECRLCRTRDRRHP